MEYPTATVPMNCFHCGDAIRVGEDYARNESRRIVCLDCEDTDDDATADHYREWASFNGVGNVDHAPRREYIPGVGIRYS